MKTARHLIISGIVQGVWFRQSTADMANSLGLAGWVRNKESGEVEALFEGEEEGVERAVAWCRKGPPRAVVESVQSTAAPVGGLEPPFVLRPTVP